MVAFEPCLATVGVAGDGSENTTIYIPYHTYTIPSCTAWSQIGGVCASIVHCKRSDSTISLLLGRAGQRCER